MIAMTILILVVATFLRFVSPMEDAWAFKVYAGERLDLDCNETRVMLAADDTISWETADGRVLSAPYNDSSYELMGQGQILSIKHVDLSKHGLYTCVVFDASKVAKAHVLRGVNLSGPLFKDLRDQYRDNIIVAVIASVVFVVPMTGMCAIQKFRYKKKDTMKEEDHAYIIPAYSERKTAPELVVSAYDNPAADLSTQL